MSPCLSAAASPQRKPVSSIGLKMSDNIGGAARVNKNYDSLEQKKGKAEAFRFSFPVFKTLNFIPMR